MSRAAMIRRAIAAALQSKALKGVAKHGGRWVAGAAAGKAAGTSTGAAAGYLSAEEGASRTERLQRAGVGAALGFNVGGVAGGSAAIAPSALRALRRLRRTGNAGPISALRRRRRA